MATPTAPTAYTPSVTPDVFETTVTIGVSGSDGVENPIQHYTVYGDISENGKSGWRDAFTWNNVKPPSFVAYLSSVQRGHYLRVYAKAHGPTLNQAFPSGASRAVRRNTWPREPWTVKVSPLTYSFENITLEWSDAGADAFGIARYDIESRVTYDEGKTFTSWAWAGNVNTTATSGKITLSPVRKANAQTEYRVWTVDGTGLTAMHAGYTKDRVKFQVTACTAPTAFAVSDTIAEGNVTLSWSGAKSGAGNDITAYEIQYSDSSNGSSWGSWLALTTFKTTATSGNYTVSPPTIRGSYRRFRIRTQGGEGASYYSAYVISSNSIRKNIAPRVPDIFAVSPATVYIEGDVTIEWSGIVPGTSEIKSHLLQIATSTDNVTWSAYSDLINIETTKTLGVYVHSPEWMEPYTRYRMKVGDVLNAFSEYVFSEIIRREYPPKAPLVSAPKNGSVTFNPRPLFLIKTQRDLAGELQTVYIKTDWGGQSVSGAWQNSVDNPNSFSKSGEFERNVNTIFKHEEIPPGVVTITINARDASATGKNVTRTFTVATSPFSERTPNMSVVKAAHMLTLRSAVNAVRDYYGLAAYAWAYEIVGGKTEIKNWGQHVLELRTAIDAIITTINDFDPDGAFNITPVEWLPLGDQRPRADVMNQLQEVITEL